MKVQYSREAAKAGWFGRSLAWCGAVVEWEKIAGYVEISGSSDWPIADH
jgi:hypothetical protein